MSISLTANPSNLRRINRILNMDKIQDNNWERESWCLWKYYFPKCFPVSSDVSEFDPIEIFNKRCHLSSGKCWKWQPGKKDSVNWEMGTSSSWLLPNTSTVHFLSQPMIELFCKTCITANCRAVVIEPSYYCQFCHLLHSQSFCGDSRHFLSMMGNFLDQLLTTNCLKIKPINDWSRSTKLFLKLLSWD